MEICRNLNRPLSVLILAILICLLAVPVAAVDNEFPIPYIRFWTDRDSCSLGHLTDCQITFGVSYGYLGQRGSDWDIIMTWNPLQMKLVSPMRMCLYQDIREGRNGCYGADYDGGERMTLQVIDPELPEGTLLTTHIQARGSEPFEQDKSIVVPEFPSMMIPLAGITGFLGIVFLLRTTKKP